MRRVITSLLLAGAVSATAVAFQAPGGAVPGQVCALLSRDLVMKISSPAGQKALASAKPIEGWIAQAQKEAGLSTASSPPSCKFGRILLALNPLAKPEQIRSAMGSRTPPYKAYEPVSGVGDAAFFDANSAYANLYVWSGSRHFHIEMAAGFDDDAEALKPNTIALANAIIPQLR